MQNHPQPQQQQQPHLHELQQVASNTVPPKNPSPSNIWLAAGPSLGNDANCRIRVKAELAANNNNPAANNNNLPSLHSLDNFAPVARINGVRPELIGGGSVAAFAAQPAPQPQPAPAPAPPRPPPTVIMGEAGGVRTMVWSQPAPTPHNQAASTPTSNTSTSQTQSISASTSVASWSSSPPSSSNSVHDENAAQLLLSLGAAAAAAASTDQPQSSPAPSPHEPQQSPQQTTPQPPTTQAPLNMERLWAGDLSQLPASQQVHALNLSAGQPVWGQPMWAQRNGCVGGNGGPGGLGGPAASGSSPVEPKNALPPAPPLVASLCPDEDDQPMICMICEDKATGLHYGIITCEGLVSSLSISFLARNKRSFMCKTLIILLRNLKKNIKKRTLKIRNWQ